MEIWPLSANSAGLFASFSSRESNFSQTICYDVDECTTCVDDCDYNAECFNTFGSFTCECQNGWEGDGLFCSDVCSTGNNSCVANASCIMNVDSITVSAESTPRLQLRANVDAVRLQIHKLMMAISRDWPSRIRTGASAQKAFSETVSRLSTLKTPPTTRRTGGTWGWRARTCTSALIRA